MFKAILQVMHIWVSYILYIEASKVMFPTSQSS
jgi:hypothetical protein